MASTHSQVLKSEFQCAECNKIFPTRRKLTGHFSGTHERAKCEFCSKICGNTLILQMHIKTLHETPKLECDFCDKKYGHKQTLSQHVRLLHLNERQHECTMCQQAFYSKKSLKSHVLSVHSNVNPVTNLSIWKTL